MAGESSIGYEEAEFLAQEDQLEAATHEILPILDANFDDPRALFLLGYIFIKADKLGLAYQVLKRASDVFPKESGIWHNLAKCCYGVQKLEEAEKYFKQALKITPNYINSLDGMGLISLNRCEYGMAIEYCNRALAEEPDLMDSLVNRGMAYLALGRWREGWDGYDKNLGLNKDRKELVYGDTPRWNGEKGLKVVCYGEQGIGDEVSFASCLPDLIRDSESVVIECDKRLEGTFKRSFPMCDVYGTRYKDERSWIKKYQPDAKVAIAQLPKFYRNKDTDFTGESYLLASPEMRLQWRALLDSLGTRPKIGIAWTGGKPHTNTLRRSMTLETLLPILRFDADFISLQYKTPPELEAFEETHGIKIHHWSWGLEAHDYDQTMALVAELDLVITVTTAIVHVAGALGKECWCLVPDKVMWRYLSKGSWFPWAKSVTLFRKKPDWPVNELFLKLKERFGDSPTR